METWQMIVAGIIGYIALWILLTSSIGATIGEHVSQGLEKAARQLGDDIVLAFEHLAEETKAQKSTPPPLPLEILYSRTFDPNTVTAIREIWFVTDDGTSDDEDIPQSQIDGFRQRRNLTDQGYQIVRWVIRRRDNDTKDHYLTLIK